jgi:hypothetical protein
METSAFTNKEEALAFIDALASSLEGKVGFRWFTERLTSLRDYVEETATESERMSAYFDSSGTRDEFEAFCARRSGMDGDEELV